MPDIRQLSPSIVNKIAAGEVIERPASVVKELMENSVDAGATRIDVTLAGGGNELIRVSDNGCGIKPEQLLLAVASHATSKIQSADDLFHVGTMGFRGEALASIAEVSQFHIRSRYCELEAGMELAVDGGQMGPVEPCGSPIGTTIEVRNLFFNTPVRRKFLKTVSTEVGHATEAFTRLALAWPSVHFTLKSNDRLLFDMPPTTHWQERIGAFFGKEIEQALIPLDSRDNDIRLSGFVCDPQQSRANNRMQYLFLNRRHIRDRSLQHALTESYRGLLLTGRFPIAFLHLEIPADMVDVNVHPTKLEVRFTDSGRLYSQLLGTLRKRFLMTDLTAQVRGRSETEPVSASEDQPTFDAHRQELVAWARGALSSKVAEFAPFPALTTAGIERGLPSDSVAEADTQGSLELRFEQRPDEILQRIRIDRGTFGEQYLQPSPTTAHSSPAAPPSPLAPFPTPHSPLTSQSGFQIHNRYLVTESDEGMLVIDQHALHERILYEMLRAKAAAGSLETQRLLVPEPVTLPPSEAATAIENQELLSRLGLLVEPFGGDTVLVTGYPAMLSKIGPAELLRQAVEILVTSDKQPDRRDLMNEMLNMMACKAAVKAGDPLAAEEITALLEQRHLFQDTHHCPHGRPTSLVFTREELDKRFKRT